MRRSWIDDDLADVFDSLFPIKSYSAVWRLYNPQEYELKPKKEFVDTLIKEKEKEIAYHEDKIKELREAKEKLETQKQE